MAKIKIKSVTKGSAPSASTVQNSTLEPDIENGDQLNTIDILPTNDPSKVPEYDVDRQFVMPPPDDHCTVLPPHVVMNPQCPVPPPPKPLPPPPDEPKRCPLPPPPPPFLPPSPCCSGGATQIVDNILVQTDDPEKITVEEGTYRGMKAFKVGATTFQGIGTTGMVPKPGPDDADKFLDSNGNWTKIVMRQSDWNQDDPTESDYIKNRPDIGAMIAEETRRAEAAEASATTEVVQGENVTVDLQIAQDGHRVYTVNADEKQDPLTFDGEYDPLTNPVATVYTVTSATENKADKVSHGVPGNFATLGSDGNLVDSGIKPNSDPSSSAFSTDVPTGGAVISIVNDLDAEVTSDTGPNVNVTVVQKNGVITGVIMSDNSASASQGALADSAIQKVKVADIQNGTRVTRELPKSTSDGNAVTIDLTDYKHLQPVVSDPLVSGFGLEFISGISQDISGIITATKKSVTVESNYNPQSGNPASGAAIADALGGLGGESTGKGDLVNVTVNTAGGEVNSVTVDDSKVVERANAVLASAIDAIDNKIQSLDASNILQDGKYITSLSETDGKIQVETGNMDTEPTTGSQKPVTSGGVKTAIDNKVAGLHGSATGKGDLVNVTVTTEGGEVTSVSVDDGNIVTATGEAIQQAIDELDVGNTLSPGTYITSLSEADGKIQVSTENMDTVPTTGSQKPVTSGGVKSAIESAVESLDYTDTQVAHQFVTEVDEIDGVISVNRAQPVISDVSGLESALDAKADKITGTFDAGNLVTVDENGNIADTGLNANMFATAEQGDKADTAVQSVKMVDGNGVELNNDTSVIIPLAAPTGSGETPGLMSAADKAKLDSLDGNLNDKADKVVGAVVGDLASLDSQGNLADSGINLMDVITGVVLEKDDNGVKSIESLVSGHVATIQETTDAEVSRILAALH